MAVENGDGAKEISDTEFRMKLGHFVENYVRRYGENCVNCPQLHLEYVGFLENPFDKEIIKGNVRNLCYNVIAFFQR